MMIGDCVHFAIEYELENEYHGVWLYGKFRFWINNESVGAYCVTSLRDILFQMTELLRDAGNRSHDVLYSLDAIELFNRLDGALYGNTSSYDHLALEETWARFHAKINVDVFDGRKIYIVENATDARVIVSNQLGVIKEFSLGYGVFDSVLYETYLRLDELYENELSKQNG